MFKEPVMDFSTGDVVPSKYARTHLSQLANQAKGGAEKITTKNGECYAALIDEAKHGLTDVAAGRIIEADAALAQLQQRRSKAIESSVSSINRLNRQG
jgi:antitoxin (DNA-binding transcriptional repressor) of toxin-antitoxin stability system